MSDAEVRRGEGGAGADGIASDAGAERAVRTTAVDPAAAGGRVGGAPADDASGGDARAAAAYLRARPALDRILREAARKYVSLGRVGGLVALESEEEAFAVRGLRCRVRKDRRVALAELDVALRERTRFGCGLVEALEAYLGAPLVTNRDAAAAEDEAWTRLLGRVRSLSPGPGALSWLDRDRSYLRAQWRTRPDTFGDELAAAIRALAQLPGPEGTLEIPRLAFQVTGDAHALDPERPAGRCFERLLLATYPELGLTPPLSAENRETLYAVAGLAVDELSSTVLVLGLEGDAELLQAARRHGHVLALPLRTLYEVLPNIGPAPTEVFAVENPSVLSAVHRALRAHPPERWPTVLCTSGHLSLAALRLLDALAARGATLRYSGDFDAGGLRIARMLAYRYGAAFHPWRFDAAAHRLALAARDADDFRDPGPVDVDDPVFAEIARAIARHGAAYQEGIVDAIVADIMA